MLGGAALAEDIPEGLVRDDKMLKKTKIDPAVSVIIPVYNTAPYLCQCLDSVVNQTLKNIQIILIDDDSTDDSFSILRKYSEKDRRITVIQQKKAGAGAARNKGLAIAQGEYLSFLDSDDFFDPAMLERMYKESKKLCVDITICQSRIFNNQTRRFSDNLETLKGIPEKDFFSYKDVYKYFDFSIGWTWDKIFRKEFIDNYNIKFQKTETNNDCLFTFTALYNAKIIHIVNEVLVTWRIDRPDSISTTLVDKFPLAQYKMFKAVSEMLKNNKEINADVINRYKVWSFFHGMFFLNRYTKTIDAYHISYNALQDHIVFENIDAVPRDFLEDYAWDELQKILSLSWDEYLLNTKNRLQGERDWFEGERNRLQGERDWFEGERNRLQGEFVSVHTSLSFHIGRMVTWFSWKMRGFMSLFKATPKGQK